MASTSDEAATTTSDETRTTDGTSTEIDEPSSSQNFESDKFIAVKNQFVTGARENSKWLWLPSEKHFYVKNRQTKKGTAYLCNDANCKIRVYMKDELCYRLIADEHNHVNGESDINKWKALNEIKALVVKDRKTSPRDIGNDVMSR